MQKGKYEEYVKLIPDFAYHYNGYGTTDILRSENLEDLNKLRGYKNPELNDLPDELYPLLMECAIEYAAQARDELCYKLTDGYSEPDTGCCHNYPNCGCNDEPETPEEEQTRLKLVGKWRSMSPKEFWLATMT